MTKHKCLSCALLILNGGHSSRMGQPKGNLPWHEGTMLTDLLRRSIAYPFSQLIISANGPLDLTTLHGELYTASSPHPLRPEEKKCLIPTQKPRHFLWQLPSGKTRDLLLIADTYRHVGPLGGFEAGLRHVIAPLVFVLSIDMPFYNFLPLRNWLYQFPFAKLRTPLPIVLPVVKGQDEPLAALYPTAILPAVTAALQGSDYSVRKLFDAAPVWRRTEEMYDSLYVNTNTPQQYKQSRAKDINQRRPVPTISIVADHSGSGKTTLCIALIKKFRSAGYTVGYVKSTHHPERGEKAGSDTDLATRAGAAIRLVTEQMVQPGQDKASLLLQQAQDMAVNIAFIESRRHGSFPAIKLIETEPTAAEMNIDSPYVAFASRTAVEDRPDLPCFKPSSIEAIYQFILTLL